LARTIGSPSESVLSAPVVRARFCDPVPREPPIGPSLKPKEARPGPAGDAGPNSGGVFRCPLSEPPATREDFRATTGDPGAATGDPGAATGDPGAATGDPGAATGDPGAATGEPDAATGDPGATAGDPGAATGDPGAATGDPGAAAGEPAAPPPNQFTASPPGGSAIPLAPGRRRGNAERSPDPSSVTPATAGSDDAPTAERSTIPPCPTPLADAPGWSTDGTA
jgi:hypothetical protein